MPDDPASASRPGTLSALELPRLADGMPGISPTVGAALAEAATVCFEEQNHSSGVGLRVDGDFSRTFMVSWTTPSDLEQAKRTWADPEIATEHGAYGVAALLVTQLTEYTVAARSRKGTGFDYWLGPKGSIDGLFQDKARLEVSGIRTGDEPAIRARVARKTKQTEKSEETGLRAVIVVVEFGTPRSRVVKK
jgi:hypothetical protein